MQPLPPRGAHLPLAISLSLSAAIAVGACEAPPEPIDATRPDVLLITLDTTRADRLGVYGSEAGLTPNLDALAATGLRFDRAYAQAAVTPVSHASIFTGLEPYHHGLRVLHGRTANRLAEEHVTLAEQLRDAGYRTAAFVSAFPVTERFGLHQGFETFDADFAGAAGALPRDPVSAAGVVSTGHNQRRADHTVSRTLEWLEGLPADDERPYFLWLHTFDPHDPLLLPDEDPLGRPLPPPERERDLLRALYDLEVAFMDREIGRLLRGLDDAGRGRDRVTVVVADHGEGLGDHDWWTHGILYEEQIRVPLLLAGPGIPAGAARSDVVRTLDIVPTVLELVGLAPEPGLDGVSLLRDEGDRAAYADSLNTLTYRFSPTITDEKDEMLFALVDGPWKYIHHTSPGRPHELFHLLDDPAELRNLVDSEPAIARRFQSALRARPLRPEASESPSDMSPEDRERLRSLGYVGG